MQGSEELYRQARTLLDARGGVSDDLFEMFEKASLHGHCLATYFVGACYANGNCVEQSVDKANEYFEKSARGMMELAEKGDADAQTCVARCFEKGYGKFPVDETKCFEWCERAAAQGFVRAQFNLANFYMSGYVKHDLEKAFVLFNKAATQGHIKARYSVGRMLKFGHGCTRDLTKACYAFEVSALGGFGHACYEAGFAYEFGVGVTLNLMEAAAWYWRGEERSFQCKSKMTAFEEMVVQVSDSAREASSLVLALKRRKDQAIDILPRELVKMITTMLWETRYDIPCWRKESPPPAPSSSTIDTSTNEETTE